MTDMPLTLPGAWMPMWGWLAAVAVIAILLLLAGRLGSRTSRYDVEGTVASKPDIKPNDEPGRPDVLAGSQGPDIPEPPQSEPREDR